MLQLSTSWGGLAPCQARLPGKGGFSPDDIMLLWFDLGPSDLHVGPSNLLIPCTLTWAGASILLLWMCTVWAIDPGFVASTNVIMAWHSR